MQTTELRFTKCHLTGENTLEINVKGIIPENIDALVEGFKQSAEVLAALGLKAWEKVVFIKTEVVKKLKKTLSLLLTIKRAYVPFAEVPFTKLTFTGTDDLSKKLRGITKAECSTIAAEYLLEKNIPAVNVHYTENGREKMIKVLNFNLYKNVNPGDSRFETFIGQTGCLLFKS